MYVCIRNSIIILKKYIFHVIYFSNIQLDYRNFIASFCFIKNPFNVVKVRILLK